MLDPKQESLMSRTQQNFSLALAQTGFEQVTQGAEISWKCVTSSQSQTMRSKVEILQRKDRFILEKFNVSFDLVKLQQTLEINARKKFQKLVSCSSRISATSDIQIILEIGPTRPQADADQRASDNHPGTLLGWTISITHTQSNLLVQMTNGFLVGAPINDWWSNATKVTTESIKPGFSSFWQINSIFELALPVFLLPAQAEISPQAWELISDNLTQSSLKTPKPIRMIKNETKLSLDLAFPNDASEPEYPIEILEARETAHFWSELDKSIIHKQRVTLPSEAQNQRQQCLLARVAASPDLVKHLPDSFPIKFSQTEQVPLIALTGSLIALNYREMAHDLVKISSVVLRKVASIYGELNDHLPMRNILAEILGDYWANVDSEQALRSWRTALTLKPHNLRVLTKIANIARDVGDIDTEFKTLLTICHHERRTPEIEKVTLRLIDIPAKHLLEDSETRDLFRQILETATRKTDFNEKIVLTLSRIQRESGEHRKALSMLESCIQTNAEQTTPTQLADLHAEIARIWHHQEKNISLATARYTAATSEPCDPTDKLLDEAEAFFTETGNLAQIKRLLLMRAKLPGRQSSTEALEKAAKYMNKLGHHEEALGAVVDLMKARQFQQWYCDIILDAFEVENKNWNEIARLMANPDSKQLPKDALPMWKLITARCAMKAGSSDDIFISNMLDRSVIRLASAGESKILLSALEKNNDTSKLTSFITTRLASADQSESQSLLDIVVRKNLVDEDGILENSLAQRACATGNFDLSLSRLKKFASLNNEPGIDALVQSHLQSLEDPEAAVKFMDLCIKTLSNSQYQQSIGKLHQLIKIRADLYPLTKIERELLIASLIQEKFYDIARDILNTSISLGEPGLSREDMVHALLVKNPEYIAQWHFINLKDETTPKNKHHHAKKALEFWLAHNSRPSQLAETIAMLSEFERPTTLMLEIMESICFRERKPQDFVNLLISELEKNHSNSSDLLYWLIRVVHSQSMNREISAKSFEKTAKYLNEKETQKLYSQAYLWLTAGNLSEAQRDFTSLLKDPESIKEPALCIAALDGLAQTKPARSNFASTIQSLISWAESAGQNVFAEQLVDKSIELSIASVENLHRRFTQDFGRVPAIRLAAIAVQALIKAERSSNGVLKLLEEWRSTKMVMDQPEKWQEVIACLTKDQHLRQLRRSTRCEILFIHAKSLFEDESKRFDSIPHFEVIALENPLDSRTWIPLYSLYEECGAKHKMISHLERIIPLIEREPGLLEKTPFNIESLKSTLSRARKSVIDSGGLDIAGIHQPADPKQSIFDMGEHAARMQRGWVEAIPVVKISAISADLTPVETSTGNASELAPGNLQSPGVFVDGTAAQSLDDPDAHGVFDANSSSDKKSVPSSANLSVVTMTKASTSKNLINWRDLALSGSAPIGSTKKVMTMAFASELEKHVAVQCIALLARETQELSNWHWQVWRNCNDFQYPTSDHGRTPKDHGLTQYGGQLHKLIKMVTPVILRVNKGKFIAENHLKKLGLAHNTLSKQVDTSHPALKRGPVGLFSQHISSAKIRFFDTHGLGAEVFFDLSQRAIHFDSKWQLELPPTVLAYKVIENLLHFQKGVPGIPFLNAELEIIPVIQNIRDVLASTGINRLRIAFGIDHPEISRQLRSINREQLISLLGWNSARTITEMKTLQQELRFKAYNDIFGSTLDLIGISESILGINICDKKEGDGDPIQLSNPIIDFLLKLSMKLTV